MFEQRGDLIRSFK